MQLILESLLNGVAIGSVLLVAALGLAIVFGLMGVINLAHGELMMVGAYSTYITQLIFKQVSFLKPFYDSYVIVAIGIAFLVSGTVGILLERTYNEFSDLNSDNQLNVLDVIALVSLILSEWFLWKE